MREIRLYGSEGGGAVCSPYPYPRWSGRSCARYRPDTANFNFFTASFARGRKGSGPLQQRSRGAARRVGAYNLFPLLPVKFTV
jgi:hypothetical protein